MKIRLETPDDYREVENLTREAFWNVYRPGCTEHYVLNQYRDNPDFIPELDLVMEHEGRIIGHVMFSKAQIVQTDGRVLPAWTFGPNSGMLCLPSLQHMETKTCNMSNPNPMRDLIRRWRIHPTKPHYYCCF